MSVIVKPGHFRRDPHPVGRLASTLLSVAVAGLADPARFRRGKAYASDGSVLRLEITPGVLRAQVAGSRGVPYDVIVAVNTVPEPADTTDPSAYRGDMTRLAPDGDDLISTCSCPDEGDPCKHAVAALLAFADECGPRPELILAWRCGDGPPVRRRARSTAERERRDNPSGSHATPPSSAITRPAPDPFGTPEWAAFTGDPVAIPAAPAIPNTAVAWRSALDVTGIEDLIDDMLAQLRRIR